MDTAESLDLKMGLRLVFADWFPPEFPEFETVFGSYLLLGFKVA